MIPENNSTHLSRRDFNQKATTGGIGTLLLGSLSTQAEDAEPSRKTTRWGFVGTGSIANAMGKAIMDAPTATLVASSSRTLSKAEDFAKKYKATRAFDSWAEMCEWDGIDAVYVATPTFVKEEISIAAAKAGKHVLCEKPLPSLPAVKRMLAACHENNVAFMDATHFSHHPRSIELEGKLDELVGKRRTLHSVFQFNIKDQENIRLSPTQEPMGVLGDAGWYNVRAIVDYINPAAKVKSISASLRRNDSQAVIGTTGLIIFDEGSSATFSCAFDAGTGGSETYLRGEKGTVHFPNFVQQNKDYIHIIRRKKGDDPLPTKTYPSKTDAAIMFDDFTKIIQDPGLRKKWEDKSLRTQSLLDAIWEKALASEG